MRLVLGEDKRINSLRKPAIVRDAVFVNCRGPDPHRRWWTRSPQLQREIALHGTSGEDSGTRAASTEKN